MGGVPLGSGEISKEDEGGNSQLVENDGEDGGGEDEG